MGAGLSEGDRSDSAAMGLASEGRGGHPGRAARMAAGGPVVPPRPALPGAAPRFSQPVRQIVLMLVVLVLVGVGAWFAYGRILPVFAANPLLNGTILVVFGLGVLTCFWQVAQLVNSASWIERFAAATSAAARRAAEAGAGQAQGARPDGLPGPAPRLLAPLAALLGAGRPGVVGPISTEAARSILESVATRIDEGRDITRYLGNLLIFLGLLGTFYGLATTVPAIVETIRTLSPQQGESGVEVFDKLMHGLETQLGGMATAFSSSLLGLAGSLVVGLLDLFASHGQNRFYRELEEWVSGFTRLAPAGAEGGAGMDRALLGAFLGDLDARLGALQDWYARRDGLRDDEAAQADARSVALAGSVERVLAGLEADRAALGEALQRQAVEAAAADERLAGVLERLAEGQARLEAGQAALVRAQGQLAEGLGQLAEAGARPVELAPELAEALDEALAQLAEGQRRLIALAEAPPPASVAMPDELSRALARITESQQRLALLLQPPGAAPGPPAASARPAEAEGEAAQRSALQRLLRRLAEGQARLVELVEARAPGQDDPEVRMRLRSIDVQLGRLVEESASARDGLISELRADLATLTRAIRGLEGRDGA